MSSSIRRARVAGWAVLAAMVVAFTTLIAAGTSGAATSVHRGITCGPPTTLPPSSPPPLRAKAVSANAKGSACADVRMTLTHEPGRVEIGRPFTAKMFVENLGPTTAFQVHAKDIPPASFTFKSVTAPGGFSCSTPAVGSNGTVDCSTAFVTAGSSFTIAVTWRPTASGSQGNQAQAQTFSSTDPNPGNNNKTDAIAVQTNTRGCTLIGTVNADVITGTAGGDVICGLAGADQIDGAGGNDTVYGQRGGDALTDHNGTDTLVGGPGDDSLDTADGAPGDTAKGNAGTNTCTTDAGDASSQCS